MQTQVQKEWIENAIERAKLLGMLNYLPNGELTHVPFSLSPFAISKSELKNMIKLTSYFNELMINVSQNWDFLHEHLSPIAQNDTFIKMLLKLRKNEITQSNQLLIQRNDFFLINDGEKNITKNDDDENNVSSDSLIRQVEINTISVSFPFLITQLCRLHRYYFEQNKIDEIVKNNPLIHIANHFSKAHKKYGYKDGIILLVAKKNEHNLFDQVGLEQIVWEKYRIKTVRKSLSEIFENATLKNGHLVLDGQVVAITYYRSGYSPTDFIEKNSFEGRKLIEASSTIQVPNLEIQLAGMKKIQQVLTNPKIISEFLEPEISRIILKNFVKMNSLDEIFITNPETISASKWASLYPEMFVLKPQREGGGNNYFGREITNVINKLNEKQLNTYVLMEKINPKTHPAIIVVNRKAEELSCVSEIGRYGICYAENGIIKSNDDIGYLVRTKSEKINEGGVCAGFSCLNSLKNC